jgi:hypothetical protein
MYDLAQERASAHAGERVYKTVSVTRIHVTMQHMCRRCGSWPLRADSHTCTRAHDSIGFEPRIRVRICTSITNHISSKHVQARMRVFAYPNMHKSVEERFNTRRHVCMTPDQLLRSQRRTSSSSSSSSKYQIKPASTPSRSYMYVCESRQCPNKRTSKVNTDTQTCTHARVTNHCSRKRVCTRVTLGATQCLNKRTSEVRTHTQTCTHARVTNHSARKRVYMHTCDSRRHPVYKQVYKQGLNTPEDTRACTRHQPLLRQARTCTRVCQRVP